MHMAWLQKWILHTAPAKKNCFDKLKKKKKKEKKKDARIGYLLRHNKNETLTIYNF